MGTLRQTATTSDAQSEFDLESVQDGRAVTSPSLIARAATWAPDRTSGLVRLGGPGYHRPLAEMSRSAI